MADEPKIQNDVHDGDENEAKRIKVQKKFIYLLVSFSIFCRSKLKSAFEVRRPLLPLFLTHNLQLNLQYEKNSFSSSLCCFFQMQTIK